MVFCGVLELCYWSGDDHREAVCGPRLLLVFLHRMSWFLIVGAPRFPRGRPTGGATQPAAHSLGKPANSFRFASCISRSEEHTSELQSLRHLVCRLLLEKKKQNTTC